MSTFGSGYGVVDGGGKGEKSRVEIAVFGGGGKNQRVLTALKGAKNSESNLVSA